MSNVHYSTNNKIGEIVLNRPKNNPLDLTTLLSLINAFEKSITNSDKCVLFKATGNNFTVGADLKSINHMIQENDYVNFSKFSQAFQNLSRVMLKHPGVIIIGLHGWVVGGGFEISLSADLRYVTDDTRVKLPELSIGTMFSNATTKLLAQIVGLGRAKEIMFLGKEIDPLHGYNIGLFNKICSNDELENEMKDTAEQIAHSVDQYSLKLAKELIHRNLDLSIEQTLDNELRVLDELSSHSVFIENIEKFANK